jgi:hypothetical protein
MLAVTATDTGRTIPGSRGLSRPASIAAASVGSRVQRRTADPACAACTASAVPQAPAPSTAMLLLIDYPRQRRAGTRVAVAEAVEQRRQDPLCLLLETIRRVDHQ